MLTTDEIKEIINREKQLKGESITAQRYYEGNHDITNYKLFYYDGDGMLKEDKTKSNIKISHPFFMELVDQLVQYMLSGKDAFVYSSDDSLQKILDRQFNNNDAFKAELHELLTGVSVKGSEYMYMYRDSKDRLRFEVADSLGIAEVRAKDTSDHCDYIVRWYIDRIDKDSEKIRKIEVWDNEKTTFFVEEGDKGIILDENVSMNPRPHTVYRKGDSLYSESFGLIPFFRLDNNVKKRSDLYPIKALIDDYDLMSCSLSNNLQDLTEGIYVVKGYNGDNLTELITNMKTKKAIGVGEEGDIDIKTVSIPYEARKVKMELDEKNIYRFGMGFNSSQIGDGNITNVVIKSRYSLLDLKCNKLEIRLKQFMRKLLKVVLKEINDEHGTDYQITDIDYDFKRETMVNESENITNEKVKAETTQIRINTLLNLVSTIDDETLIMAMCDELDFDYEEIKGKIADMKDEQGLQDAKSTLNGIEPIDEPIIAPGA